jgi:hypothetical protein
MKGCLKPTFYVSLSNPSILIPGSVLLSFGSGPGTWNDVGSLERDTTQFQQYSNESASHLEAVIQIYQYVHDVESL